MRSELPSLTVASLRIAGVATLLAAVLAGCSQAPAGKRSKEFFSSSVYGAASPRVVEDGQEVPRGGGRYLVGRPYTVAGRVYTPKEVALNTSQTGKASWYGAAFHGRRTSNGEVYDMRSISAAHPTWPLPSYVRITNTGNGRSMIVRLNDRGPFHSDRIMDVSSRVADALDFKRIGTANIKVDYVGKAGLAGSDDQTLMASLRTDGRPATLDGVQQTMIADASEPVKNTAPGGPRWTFFQPDPAPEGETSVVARQNAEALSPAGGSVSGSDVTPPRRPPSLDNSSQQAFAAPESARVASVAPVQAIDATAGPVGSKSFNPPLPPVRPLSLR
jgi:rare lipoprotein A